MPNTFSSAHLDPHSQHYEPQPSSSKPRRTVRMFAGIPDSSSSDEEDASRALAGLSMADGGSSSRPHDSRISSYPGAQPTSPTSQLASIINPKLNRASTSSAITASSSRLIHPPGPTPTPASALAPPPSNEHIANNIRGFMSRIAPPRRTASSKSAGSAGSSSAGGKGKAREDHRGLSAFRSGMIDMVEGGDYFHADSGLGKLDDSGSEDEEDGPKSPKGAYLPLKSVGRRHLQEGSDEAVSPGELKRRGNMVGADTSEGMERLGWQSMLASVLRGDVLKGEASRQGVNRPDDETMRREVGLSFWWQIRAKMRGRTEEEERRRVEERRGRVVDRVLEEVDQFVVKTSRGPAAVGRRLSAEDRKDQEAQRAEQSENTRIDGNTSSKEEAEHESELSALDQVGYILEKLSVIETLYPTSGALRAAKPLYNSPDFQARVAGLTAWVSVVTSLQSQLGILRRWTGSDELDITKPNTTKEKALVTKKGYHPLDAKAKAQAQALNDQAADDSTFLERLMKEDNLRSTFLKRTMIDNLNAVLTARDTVMAHHKVFEELSLPDFQYELIRLIAFPVRLILEALKVRLDAAAKLVSPGPIVIQDMTDNFRLIMSLAVAIKQDYGAVARPDPENHWHLPPCFPDEYDAVLLDGLRMFFKLVHWNLRLGQRAMYFSETGVLEEEWVFLYGMAEGIPGGDLVVAEHFCNLTNKLMVRVGNYFDTQLHLPIPMGPNDRPKRRALQKALADGTMQSDKRPMTTEEMLGWFGKILDVVKMRYRKLQKFSRLLTQRFDNSTEYALDDENLNALIEQLHATGHFLVYTQVFEERGTYIIADGSLWGKPDDVRALLTRAFFVKLHRTRPMPQHQEEEDEVVDEVQMEVRQSSDDDEDDEEAVPPAYVLLLSPRQSFAWHGAVMTLNMDYVEYALEDSRIRLIADGPQARLQQCRELFLASLEDVDEGQLSVAVQEVVYAQAHLPNVQRELKKIARSTQRLNESIIESAAHVRRALGGVPGTQDMIENWYNFASDHGRRVSAYVPESSKPRFVRLLMRLAISWVSFICDSCDPTDRRTFRWTVNALKHAHSVTGGENILHLDAQEFGLLRKSVAALVSFLILHFDVLGARSSMEAKREADRLEAMRRLQRIQENFDDDFLPPPASPNGANAPRLHVDRSIRLVQESRMQLISELEAQRGGVSSDQHLTGQVLDEQVNEDRALVFLAASSSNIALRWQQGAFIGGGANGNVYIGFNLDSGGIMAVKEIRVQDFSNSPTLYKQIKDESDVMSMLQHPNIVEYYGIEVHRDRVYIFEEYCEGGSLANLLEHGRVEDEEVCMVYALQMLQGLEYLHSKGVEHRDVKPDNILLGTNSTIKFVDFGAAKVIVKGNRTMAKTRIRKAAGGGMGADGPEGLMNSLAGTPMYMAPEVIKNEKSGRLGASDIWSMGCCLLEIVTGRKPWSNLDNEWAIMFHIGIATQHPPLPNPGELSDLGIDFIEQCVTLDPAERPTATELLYHPWLAPMVQAMAEHALTHPANNNVPDNVSSTSGVPSLTSTLVDPEHGPPYAQHVADIIQAEQDRMDTVSEGVSSFGNTPAEGTPDASLPNSKHPSFEGKQEM